MRFELVYGTREDNAHWEIVRDFAAGGARSLPKGLGTRPVVRTTAGACANMVVNTDGSDCDPAVDVAVPRRRCGRRPGSRSTRPEHQVRLQVSAEAERGIEADGPPVVPAEIALKAKAVVASVLEHYFGPGR